MSGRKQWTTFERLTAADVNTYLADQSVMAFATAAARDTAIPSPIVGMLSAVQAAPDTGAPRYWDGSSWTLMSAAVTNPNPLDIGVASAIGSTVCNVTVVGGGAWVELTSGLPDNVLLLGISMIETDDNHYVYEIATGAASSEVVRFVTSGPNHAVGLIASVRCPWPVYIPASTRIAVRALGSGSRPIEIVLFWVEVASGTQVEAGTASETLGTNSTWIEIAATPPKAGGVEIVGIIVRHAGTSDYRDVSETFELGFGAASSEVAATPSLSSLAFIDGSSWLPPVTWAAGTRLAIRVLGRNDFYPGRYRILWRESL